MGRVRDRHRRRNLSVFGAVMCIFQLACVRLEYSGRDHLRIAPLKQEVTLPAEWSPLPVHVDAGSDALSDEELAPLPQRLMERIQAEAAALQRAGVQFSRGPGQGTVRSCDLRAGAGRRNTVYKASCHAVWRINDVVVAEARGIATLFAPAKAVTRKQAEEIAKTVRNPLLSAADARRVLEEASVHSMHQLIGLTAPSCGHAVPPDAQRNEILIRATPAIEFLRQRARKDLASIHAQQKRAAVADLMRYGEPEDANAIHVLLDAPDPVLRRTAALALSELVWAESLMPLVAHRDDPDAETRRLVRLGIARIRAFYGFTEEGDFPMEPATRGVAAEPDIAGSSKSSTPGGRDTAEIPASAR